LWLHNRTKVKISKKAVTTLHTFWQPWLKQRNRPTCQLQKGICNSEKTPPTQFCRCSLVLSSSFPTVQLLNLSSAEPISYGKLGQTLAWFCNLDKRLLGIELRGPSSFHLSETVSEARSLEVKGYEFIHSFQNLTYSFLSSSFVPLFLRAIYAHLSEEFCFSKCLIAKQEKKN